MRKQAKNIDRNSMAERQGFISGKIFNGFLVASFFGKSE